MAFVTMGLVNVEEDGMANIAHWVSCIEILHTKFSCCMESIQKGALLLMCQNWKAAVNRYLFNKAAKEEG